ncbi:caspase family protein [Nocardia sp. CDC153]|uniref:caspase, EACC1-associated type n=1 Tax=Nocardia sp. CDC153 TaxID=3112167 RepID=UPI002DB64449|nr:caspase family protein [Nocardia sp. CDC153]MEC3955870.1 caspase family protein [Nocardia sp. CDC153]
MTLPDPEATRAVLIGTAHYDAHSGLDSFPEIARSLSDFAEFLRTHTGIPERHIDVVLDPADGSTIAAAITAAARAATGLLLVYYVGHGVVVDNQLHLTHTGTRVDEADVTALRYPIVRSRIKSNARGAVVVILDCCHSGKAFGHEVLAADGEILRAATDIDGAFVLTATDEKTKFAVAKGDGGRTAFTGMMLDILRTGVPTADRYLTMSVLFRELRDRLPAANMPKPKALERGTAGRVALAANAGWTGRSEPVGLPELTATAYTAQIRDLTPADGLLDREAELRELAEFCSGDEPYVWWQAGPWAGKTAIMTWFALHPPPNVRVVSFFVTSRLAAQDDHTAFTDAVLEQLSVLVPDHAAAVARAGQNRDALRRHLLELAAQRAADSGGRLVLLVDGLDEDRGRPSIASLLPKNPGPGLRVIVAARPHPELPLDVPGNHPLHHCRRREVDRSRAAFGIIQAARLELHGILDRSDDDQQILGLITAAHGLTASELEDLTGLPPFRIEKTLTGVTGRTFRAYTSRYAADKINLLAHETLQREAETALGRTLMERYRERIHAWAARYREQGWPNRTPAYLLTRYFSMLRGQRDVARMTALALDTVRHDRLLDLTGGDGTARNEIATVSRLWLADRDPDLLSVSRLAMRRRRLTQRGTNVPVRLPAALALLGDLPRAQSLVDGMLRSGRRLRAQIALDSVQFSAADPSGNRSLVEALRKSTHRTLTDNDRRRIATGLIDAGDPETAAELAQEIITLRERVRVLAQLVSAWRAADRRAELEVAIGEIHRHALLVKGPDHRDEILSYAVAAFADIGDFEEGFSLGRLIESADFQAVALCRIARSMALQGEPEPAAMCVGSALAIGRSIVDLVERSSLLARVAPDLVAGGFRDELRAEVDTIETGLAGSTRRARIEIVEHLVECLVVLEDPDRALGLARRFAPGTDGLDILTAVLPALVAADRIADGRRLAAEIERASYQTTDPYERGFAFYTVIRAQVIARDMVRAAALADRIDDSGCRFLVFTHLGTRPDETAQQAAVFLETAIRTLHLLLDRVIAGDEKALWEFTRTVLVAAKPDRDGPAPLAELTGGLIAVGAIDAATGLGRRLAGLYSSWAEPPAGLDYELGCLAAVFVELGHADRLHAVLDRIFGVVRRCTVLRYMVENAGIEVAAPIVGPLLDEFEKTVAAADYSATLPDRVSLVLLSAALGDGDRVGRLVDGLSPLDLDPQHVYSVLAAARARTGPVGEAAMIASVVSDEMERSLAYREVVAALVRAGQEQRALRFSERIPLVGERIRALAVVIPALSENLGTDTARTILRDAALLLGEISRADLRDLAVESLVEVALAIGDGRYAEQLAHTTEGETRSRLLTRIVDARVRTSAGLPPAEKEVARREIRRLLAEVWTLGPWFSALDVLARFDPNLLADIADEALRLDAEQAMTHQMKPI